MDFSLPREIDGEIVMYAIMHVGQSLDGHGSADNIASNREEQKLIQRRYHMNAEGTKLFCRRRLHMASYGFTHGMSLKCFKLT